LSVEKLYTKLTAYSIQQEQTHCLIYSSSAQISGCTITQVLK